MTKTNRGKLKGRAVDAKALAALAPAAMTLARAEGLEAHRRSAEIRVDAPPSREP